MLYDPYDSFGPVFDFVHKAAHTPNVLAIEQTIIYRTGNYNTSTAPHIDREI